MSKKLYLLMTLLAVFFIPLSMVAQTCPGESRAVTDCKAGTNDRIGAVLKDFFMDGSTATWNFEAGATWTDNANGTATLTGVMSHYGNPNDRKMTLSVTFTNRTTTAPSGSPVLMNTPGIPTVGWQYFDWSNATLTGVAGTHMAGAQLTLVKRDKAFQMGIGAADQLGEQTKNGGTGWFAWIIESQPSNRWLEIRPFPATPSIDQADLCIRIVPCTGIPPSTLTLTCGNNIVVTVATGANSAIINYTVPTATTTCTTGGATVTRTSGPASGSAFPIGTSQVCFSATDNCGNTKTCCFSVTVNPGETVCDNVTNGGTISKTCSNGVITLSGTAPVGGSGALEYQWLRATGSCPSSISQAIAGETNASLTVTASSITATTYYVRCVRRAGCTDANSWVPGESNCISIAPNECPPVVVCDNVTNGGTISKTCSNGVITLSGTAPVGGSGALEYQWLRATGSCPSSISQAIAGETNASLTVTASSITATTYYVRCVRRAGCTDANSWVPGESNCISIAPNECPPVVVCDNVTNGGTISKTCSNGVITLSGTAPIGGSGALEYQWLRATGSCPSSISQAIAGETNASLTVTASSITATTYYVRCVRRAGCTDANSWVPGESNCISIAPNECPTTGGGTCTKYTVSDANDCVGGSWIPYGVWISGTNYRFKTGGMFQKNADGTATLMGNLTTDGWSTSGSVNATFSGMTTTPPAGSPKYSSCTQGASAAGWMYYTSIGGSITIGGQVKTLAIRGEAFQVGIGANWQNAGDLGASGWYTLNGTTEGDFNIRLSNPVDCGGGDPCLTDAVPPTIVCPANIVKTATGSGSCWTTAWTAPTATDNCPGTVVVTQTSGPANGACLPIGTSTVVYKATDAKGNMATCSFTITINPPVDPCLTDAVPPTIVCPANIVKTATGSGSCWTTAWTAPTATDNCPGTVVVTQTSGPANGACLPIGTSTVVYKATDAKGNMATCSFTITINPPVDPCLTDAVPPTIVCPANIVKTATGSGSCWTTAWTAPTATDNCPGTVVVTQTSGPANGACLPIGTSTVVYKATDAKGNMATCSFTITINPPVDPCLTDAVPPTIVCPANIVKTATGSGSCWTTAWTAPTATDNCPGTVVVTQTSGPANGACLPIGTSTVVYKATDAKGNMATCSFTITINPPIDPCLTDAVPPTIVCPANIVKTATGSGSCWTTAWTAPTATDNCPGTVVVTQTSGPANGACLPIGTSTVVYKATDAKGNMATCSFTITINPPVDPCQGIVSVRPITNTKSNCNTATSYVALWNGVFYTAGTNLKFTEYTNGTATITGNIHANGATYTVNATFSGRTCTSAGSPKLGDGNGVCGAYDMNSTNWYYYTGLSGTMTTAHGTINLTRNGPAFQVGNFANLQQNVMGASGWFMGNGTAGGDFNFNLGTCTSCCSGQPAISCNNPTNCDGSILVERWYSSTSNFPIVIPGGSPNITVHQGNTFGPWDIRNNYTSRVRGYIVSSTSGNHTFNITGDDNVELFLSTTSSPSGMIRRTYIQGWTGANENYKYASQTSSSVHLIAGQRYYFELRHAEFGGADGWKIFWKTPTNSSWQIIQSQNLSRPCNNIYAKAATDIALTMDAIAEPSRTKIQWVNNSGLDNDYFSVEKMNPTTGNFEELEKVNTIATDRTESYLAYDNAPTEGDNFYRVKLTFADGSTKFSEIRQVNFTNLNTIRVFPNPAYDYIDLDLKQLKGREANIYLYNSFGQQVQFVNIEKVGENTVRLDIAEQTTGNYLIRVSAKGKRDMTKQLNISK